LGVKARQMMLPIVIAGRGPAIHLLLTPISWITEAGPAMTPQGATRGTS
jgi:hypothetical protein